MLERALPAKAEATESSDEAEVLSATSPKSMRSRENS